MRPLSGRTPILLTAAMALAAALPGCDTLATYTDGRSALKSDDPNKGKFDDVVVETMTWAGVRYGFFPADDARIGNQPFALSLPGPVDRDRWLDICDRIGPECFPKSSDNSDLPFFHIAEVRVRGDRGEIDLYRPVLTVGGEPAPATVHQFVTVTLKGSFDDWRVIAHRGWSVEPYPAPVANEIPAAPPPEPAQPGPTTEPMIEPGDDSQSETESVSDAENTDTE